MRRGLPQVVVAKRALEGNRAHATDPDIDRWENEGGSVGNRGLAVKRVGMRPAVMRL